ncbi:MAG TPA: competence protein ComEC, partial [Bradyrhizobium sp.]|nr:competence protein ComEC [Bradyrhizobium sp.]
DPAGCVTQLADGGFVALAQRPDALADDCARAALLITMRQAPVGCAASVIDQERLRRQGALVLRRISDGFAVEAIRPKGVDRPWSPAVAGDAETDTGLIPRAAPRSGVDATPAEADQREED